jgi:hypothetical protein
MPEEHRYLSNQLPRERADVIYDGSVALEYRSSTLAAKSQLFAGSAI